MGIGVLISGLRLDSRLPRNLPAATEVGECARCGKLVLVDAMARRRLASDAVEVGLVTCQKCAVIGFAELARTADAPAPPVLRWEDHEHLYSQSDLSISGRLVRTAGRKPRRGLCWQLATDVKTLEDVARLLGIVAGSRPKSG